MTILLTDGTTQTAEVQAGSGYLSQSSPRLVFGRTGTVSRDADATTPAAPKQPGYFRIAIAEITVRWPDGKSTTHPIEDQSARFVQLHEPSPE